MKSARRAPVPFQATTIQAALPAILAVILVLASPLTSQAAPATNYVKLSAGQSDANIDFWGDDTDTVA